MLQAWRKGRGHRRQSPRVLERVRSSCRLLGVCPAAQPSCFRSASPARYQETHLLQLTCSVLLPPLEQGTSASALEAAMAQALEAKDEAACGTPHFRTAPMYLVAFHNEIPSAVQPHRGSCYHGGHPAPVCSIP